MIKPCSNAGNNADNNDAAHTAYSDACYAGSTAYTWEIRNNSINNPSSTHTPE